MTTYQVQGFLRKKRWRFAVTMLRMPHEYTVRQEHDPSFTAVVSFIQARGSVQRFRGRPYRYLMVGGYKYWTMGNPPDDTRIINRVQL